MAFISIFCVLSLRSQNVWIENSTNQSGCSILTDELRMVVFDPYGYAHFDEISLSFGDTENAIISLDSSNNIDSTIVHHFPSCGTYRRDFQSEIFELQGNNVQPSEFPYYFSQDVTYTTPSFFYFQDSPRFDLKYELTRCNTNPFFVNPLFYEVNGDSLHFELDSLSGHLPIPDGIDINPLTGEVSWIESPDTGLYQFELKVTERRRWDQVMGVHMAKFSIKVTDSCQTLSGHDNINNENLFETQGREFNIHTNQSWSYSFRVAKSDWDSITIKSSSEIFEHSFFDSDYSVTDIGDSIETSISWLTDSIHKRNHPYVITYHVTAYKNGNAHHRVLTNAVYVDWLLSTGDMKQDHISIQIFPNPTKDKITISSPQSIDQVTLLNSSGLSLLELTPSKTTSDVINIGHLADGLYILRIKTGEGLATKKLIKSESHH
ncbi:MAG: T9SS type A sorting domain-containing protein [Salibacteraceae bacterium]